LKVPSQCPLAFLVERSLWEGKALKYLHIKWLRGSLEDCEISGLPLFIDNRLTHGSGVDSFTYRPPFTT
jgi:hypothetical protein